MEDITKNLPDTVEGCEAEMNRLDLEIARIQADLTAEAGCNYSNRSLQWVARANYARKLKGKRRTILQNEAARLRKLERQQQRETWARAFVEAARELLKKEQFDSLMEEADRRLAAPLLVGDVVTA